MSYAVICICSSGIYLCFRKTSFFSVQTHIRFTIALTGNFSCFCCCLLSFFKSKFFTKFFHEHYQRVKQVLDPDQDRRSVGPDLGSNCLQR